jgi:hypothetical protein
MDPETIREQTETISSALLAGNANAVRPYLGAGTLSGAGIIAKLPRSAHSFQVVSVEDAADGIVARTRFEGAQDAVILGMQWAERDGIPKIVALGPMQPDSPGPEDWEDWPG